VKSCDNYNSKYALWASSPVVHPLPRLVGVPAFKSRKFDSYEEFNQWKRELLKEIARNGGVTWTK
jgi:hypothetical protein